MGVSPEAIVGLPPETLLEKPASLAVPAYTIGELPAEAVVDLSLKTILALQC